VSHAKHAQVTPGEILREDFLVEYGLSQDQLAKAVGISPNRIREIVNNRRRITAHIAVRLSLYFGNSPEFWMNLQMHYDLKTAREDMTPEEAKRIICLGTTTEAIDDALGAIALRQELIHGIDRLRAAGGLTADSDD
jgi:addiction module HigA family antidote